MDFSFTEEQQAVRELASQIFADHASDERIRRSEASPEGIDRELWNALAQANLLGLAVSEAHGGLGLDETDLVLLLEEVGRVGLADPLASTAVGTALLASLPDAGPPPS